MVALIEQTKLMFLEMETQLQHSTWGQKYYPEFKYLSRSLDEPCIVAVVGQVNAGKSTFVNALLGQKNYAKVGNEETTALLTYFKYGIDESIKCFWKNGEITSELDSFLERIQGHNEKALAIVSEISHVEIYLNSPFLKEITIVDTPGTESIVVEHEYRTNDVIQSHIYQTEQLNQEATAIIYLVGSVNPNTEQKKYLEIFRQITNGVARPMNSIGVMSKIDLSSQVLSDPQRYSKKIYEQLKEELNTVVPVSVALYSFLKNNTKEQIGKLQKDLKKIPNDLLSVLLSNHEAFKKMPFEQCPLSPNYRTKMASVLPWEGFKNVAKILLETPLEEAISKISTLAGIDQLIKILKLHFFDRSRLLVCYKAISKVLAFFNQLEKEDLVDLQKQEQVEIENKGRFIEFLKGFNYPVAKELTDFVLNVYSSSFFEFRSIEFIETHRKNLNQMLDQLDLVNKDFYSRTYLTENYSSFTNEEIIELNMLFGGIGYDYNSVLDKLSIRDKEDITKKYLYWKDVEDNSQFGSIRKELATTAINRMSRLFNAYLDLKP